MIPRSVRSIAGHICCTLGILWAAAGALKELFGIHVMAPFIPPLDLQRINEGEALFIGVCLYVAGSWLLRFAEPSPRALEIDDGPGVPPSRLASGSALDDASISPRRTEERVRR